MEGGGILNGKWLVPILTLFLLAIVVGGYWGYQQYQTKEQLKVNLENQYQLSFRELVDDVENLEVQTAKALVSNSPRQTMVNLSDIWRNARDAQNNLSRLPFSHVALTRTQRFLTQIGDYSHSVAKASAPEINLKPNEWRTLNDLYEQARYLSAQLHQLEMSIDEGRISWTEMERKGSRRLARASGDPINNEFRVMEDGLKRYPTLAYNGVFSDSLQTVPVGLQDKPVTSKQALEIAKRFVAPERENQYVAQKVGEGEGTIATYSVEIRPRTNQNTGYVAGGPNSGRIYLDVSKKGGEIVWMINNREVNAHKIVFRPALEQAQTFLKERGYQDMVLTSYMEYQRSMIFSFAPRQDKVVLYPDLVKVKVALDNGQILGMDAVSYLMSHRDRELPKPELTLKEARDKLNPRLKVERSQLVLIPLDTKEEVLCYEFLVTMNNQRFLVYINALNGREENILRIVEDKNLLLTM